MKRWKENRGFGLKVTLVCVLTALILGAAGAVFVADRLSDRGGKVTVTSDLIGERLAEASDLVTQEYYYTDVRSISKSELQVWGVSIPFTGSRAIISYEGVIRYGVNVADVGYRIEGSAIVLEIPESRMVSHEIQDDSTEIFDEGRNVFNPVTQGDVLADRVEMKTEMEARAEEKGILTAAREQAGETLKAFLGAFPDMAGYTVTYELT